MTINSLSKKKKISLVLLLTVIVLSIGYYLYDLGYVLTTNFVAEKIVENNWVPEGGVGIAGIVPRQFELFQILLRKASNQELIDFVSSDNAALKCYAFWGLVLKKDSNVYDLLIKNLHDTTSFRSQGGCIMRHTNVREFFIEKSFSQFSVKEISELDSIMFHYDYDLFSYYQLVETLEPKPEYYNEVKKEIIEKRNWRALIGLARYQDEKDIEFIKSALQNDTGRIYVLNAIREFPDERFFPILEKIHEQNESDSLMHFGGTDYYEFYNTLVRYKTPRAINMIRESINNEHDKFNSLKMAVWLAIKRSPNDFFNDLLDEIKLSEEDYEYLDGFI